MSHHMGQGSANIKPKWGRLNLSWSLALFLMGAMRTRFVWAFHTARSNSGHAGKLWFMVIEADTTWWGDAAWVDLCIITAMPHPSIVSTARDWTICFLSPLMRNIQTREPDNGKMICPIRSVHSSAVQCHVVSIFWYQWWIQGCPGPQTQGICFKTIHILAMNQGSLMDVAQNKGWNFRFKTPGLWTWSDQNFASARDACSGCVFCPESSLSCCYATKIRQSRALENSSRLRGNILLLVMNE